MSATYFKTLSALDLLQRGAPVNNRPLTVAQACKEVDLGVHTFHRLVREDETLSALYKTALAVSEDAMADMLVNIDELQPDARMAHVISKNIQWLLARRRRQDYGDHVTVEHTRTRDQVLLKMIEEAKAREQVDGPTLERMDDEDALRLLGLPPGLARLPDLVDVPSEIS